METPEVKQNHGLTHKEMADLRIRQIQDQVDMRAANNAGDNIKDELFKKDFFDYQIPKHESHVWHVATESRLFNQATGERQSSAVVKTYTPEAYKFQKENHGFDGMTTHVLHNPEIEDGEPDDTNDLSLLTVDQLKKKYKDISGNEAPKGIKKGELIHLIEESQQHQ